MVIGCNFRCWWDCVKFCLNELFTFPCREISQLAVYRHASKMNPFIILYKKNGFVPLLALSS